MLSDIAKVMDEAYLGYATTWFCRGSVMLKVSNLGR